jgi:transposase
MQKNSKKGRETGKGKMTIGLDLGDQHGYYYMLEEGGENVESGRVKTSREGLEKRFRGWEAARVVIEAGTHSPWVSRLLADCGHEVIVANPRKLRLISENDGKDDPIDAALLARLGRVDPELLSPIEHRSEEAQADLAVIRGRDALVAARTQLVNHVRGAVKSLGARLERCSTPSFAWKVADQVPAALGPALEPLLGVIAEMTEKIDDYDRQIRRCCRDKYPETKLLEAVPGVGPLTALGYVLTLEDPHRFAHSRSVGSFLGLRPGQDKSGQHDPELRITRAGSPLLRRLLVGSAHYILGPFGPDTDLRRWGLKLASRGRKNAKKRAVVAVARKLAVLLHRLWVNGEVYQPLYQKERAAAVAAATSSGQ